MVRRRHFSMNKLPLYLDHNATTPVHPEVVAAMLPCLRETFGNPSSGHVYGQRARAAVEQARAHVASLLGCEPDEVVFTSGGTEANNLAIRGVVERSPRRRIVTSTVEHPATAEPCAYLETRGVQVVRIPVDTWGRVTVDGAAGALSEETALVTLILAQNETGTLMPITEIARIAHARGALVHTDAAQGVGKIRTRVGELGIDLLSVAGHKLYAPKGVGALYVRRGTLLTPFVRGAGHERGMRPGTENVASIVGLGKACELAERDLETESNRQRRLRDELWEGLRAAMPFLRLNGHPVDRLPNTVNACFPGVAGTALLAAAPTIAASTGSACHDGAESASPVLLAMGLDPDLALGAVRLSIGRSTTSEQVAEAVAALVRAYGTLA
jgi:cysteine desulfurase